MPNRIQRPPERATIGDLESTLAKLPQVEMPVVHRFTPGMYIREITMPAGTLVTSATHLTEHPFVILRGVVRVASETEGSVIYRAPHIGITKPGTKRALHVIEETVWVTFHATDETDVGKIGAAILAPDENPFLPEDFVPGWKNLPEP